MSTWRNSFAVSTRERDDGETTYYRVDNVDLQSPSMTSERLIANIKLLDSMMISLWMSLFCWILKKYDHFASGSNCCFHHQCDNYEPVVGSVRYWNVDWLVRSVEEAELQWFEITLHGSYPKLVVGVPLWVWLSLVRKILYIDFFIGLYTWKILIIRWHFLWFNIHKKR